MENKYPEYNVTIKKTGEQIRVTWHPTRNYVYVDIKIPTNHYHTNELDGLPDSITKFKGVL